MNVPLFESMADLLIPAGTDMPSASQAGVGTAGLAEVLKFRPDLRPTIDSILAHCEGKSPQEALNSLDGASRATFAEVVASAYFMNEAVREKLNYHGQQAKPIVPEMEDALLQSVLDRGPIYREAK